MTENSNCTWYKDGVPVRGEMNIEHSGYEWFAGNEAFNVTTFSVAIKAPPNDNGKTRIVYPGVYSSYLALDDTVKAIPETVYDYTKVMRIWHKPWTWVSPLRVHKYKTIYHDIGKWEWRNPDVVCAYCGSLDYNSGSHGIHRCNFCGRHFGHNSNEESEDGD